MKRPNTQRIPFFFSFILHLSITSTLLFLFLRADPSARNGNCVAEKFKDGEKSISAISPPLFSVPFKRNASSFSMDTTCVTGVNNYFSSSKRTLPWNVFSSNFRRIKTSEDFPSRRSHLSNKLFSEKHHRRSREMYFSFGCFSLYPHGTVFFFLSLPILDIFIYFPRNITGEYVDICASILIYIDPDITHRSVVPLVCRKKIKRDSMLRLKLFV